jgi:hypothetical protein
MEIYVGIREIYALGTSGKVKGKKFKARKNNKGFYVLNKKSKEDGINTTNRAKNIVLVETLEDALNLLKTNDYLINLVCDDNTRALREHAKIIVYFY